MFKRFCLSNWRRSCVCSKLRHLFDVSGGQRKDFRSKHFKCICWIIKHLPLPLWNTVIRIVLSLRRFFPAVLGFHPALTRRPPVLSKKRHCQDAKTSDNERKLDSVKLEKLLKWFSRALTAILYHVVNAFLMIKVRSCIYIVRRRIRKCSWSRPLWTAVTNTWLCLSFSSILQNLTRNIITRRVQYAAGSCVLIHLWNIIHSKSNLGTGVDPLLISPYDWDHNIKYSSYPCIIV